MHVYVGVAADGLTMLLLVNTTKQASAFPPNFVHSLDATHMMLTALECRAQGLTFASVHDSYWTHPSSIDQMSAIIRDTFIALHSSDVLKGLYDEVRLMFCSEISHVGKEVDVGG